MAWERPGTSTAKSAPLLFAGKAQPKAKPNLTPRKIRWTNGLGAARYIDGEKCTPTFRRKGTTDSETRSLPRGKSDGRMAWERPGAIRGKGWKKRVLCR